MGERFWQRLWNGQRHGAMVDGADVFPCRGRDATLWVSRNPGSGERIFEKPGPGVKRGTESD